MTFKTYIILLKTIVNKQSLYDHSLKVEDKPLPRILCVDPKALVQHEITNIEFK